MQINLTINLEPEELATLIGLIGIKRLDFLRPQTAPDASRGPELPAPTGTPVLPPVAPATQAVEAHQRRLAKMFLSAGIPAHFRDFTLETLIQRAGDDPDKIDAIALVRQFVNDGLVLDPYTNRYKPGIILSGTFGCGKTGLLTPVLRHMVEQGRSGLWVEVYDLISAIQQGYADGDSNEKLTTAQKADVILLDDLGDVTRNREETEDRRRIVYQLINYRHNNALPMLITTNCDAMQLTMQFGGRTVERIVESCAWVPMGGRNLRTERV